MIDLAGNYVLLADHLQGAGASSIFRSLLEAYVEIVNLDLDPNYHKFVYARFHKDKLLLMESAKSGNSYLHLLPSHSTFSETLSMHYEKLQQLKNSDFNALSVK